ncbi:uncharacterized protein LOC135154153 [Lytechinus pictus]|uniref:uncharacterized protein LOC135154153 n=1 Tax=Lytechinus pictus TaxID=7653 RepID=UPI0030BA1074
MNAIKDEMELTKNKMPITDHLPTMLAAYFGEKEATLICKYQDETRKRTPKEIEDELVLTPCIVIGGERQIQLAVDGKLMKSKIGITSLAKATKMLFEAFYVFSVSYPASSTNTLDFIQRYVIGINPCSTKFPRGKQGKCASVPLRVIKLANELALFESDWCL